MTGVCKQMYKEFMSDVLHITSHSEHDDVTQLQTYLLQGQGWLMLQILYEKGPQVTHMPRCGKIGLNACA
ncbi:hypothetical protein DPMN_027793 [Dreissena polymorpha]|uniref:Uncharacterized protein n=1 Tax=Dreissena polymorpha TaxID=45954 RepID=A0A9D4RFK0_DREPO|nr:hypothetical protein DPMN_027793 [Dreissena polymorpha]